MPAHPNTIALELSQRNGSVAMMNNFGHVESKRVDCNKRNEDDIFPALEELKNKLQLFGSNIELVVVNTGPGGFTGLRTSVSIAKMISLANQATIVPVESAIVCAEHSNAGTGPFLVISSVKDDYFWLSRVQQVAGTWECESANSTATELSTMIDGIQAVFADEFIPAEAHRFIEQREVPILPISLDASALLRVGVSLYHAGSSIDPAQLLPTYPREPEAVVKWKAKDTTK